MYTEFLIEKYNSRSQLVPFGRYFLSGSKKLPEAFDEQIH